MSEAGSNGGALDVLPGSDGEVSVQAIVIGIHKFVIDQSFAEFFPPVSRQMYAFECTLTDGVSTVCVAVKWCMNHSSILLNCTDVCFATSQYELICGEGFNNPQYDFGGGCGGVSFQTGVKLKTVPQLALLKPCADQIRKKN